MKKNSLLLLLLLVNLTSFSQKAENGQNELKEIFLSLPDSVLSNNLFDLNKKKGGKLWELYNKKEYEKTKTISSGDIIGYLNILFRNDTLNVNGLIDEKGKLIRIMEAYSDDIPTYEIKIFQNTPKIIGLTLKYYDNVTIVTEKIVFYEFKKHKFRNITNDVLEGFNFFTDNYSKATIDSLNKFYSCNLRVEPKNRKLLYRFTESDTVFITYDFFDYYYFNDELLDLHQEKHDEENHMKKYIMKKGKLKLAE